MYIAGVTAYVASVYLHILAAATWVGGIIFLVAVIVPSLRKLDATTAGPMLRATVFRFRALGWVAFAVLLVTGLYNLHARGIGWTELTDPAYRATASGKADLSDYLIGLRGRELGASTTYTFDRALKSDPRFTLV